VALLAVVAVHQFRLHQMTSKLNDRFEERLAERMRVAQILHDTLLQGVISASMQLHVAVDQLPTGSPALEPLHRVLQSMGQVVEEGGNTLRGLRSTMESVHDLERSLAQIPQELNLEGEVGFRVKVKGRALPLQSSVRVDLYSIGREALLNALRHSRASNVGVELRYTANEFRLVVHDDGRGIDPKVLRAGRDGQSGLSRMRERAERIGAGLHVRRRIAGGTAVDLRVPGTLAFESHPSGRTSGWFTRLQG
jgi:signal transduction histidine kinase